MTLSFSRALALASTALVVAVAQAGAQEAGGTELLRQEIADLNMVVEDALRKNVELRGQLQQAQERLESFGESLAAANLQKEEMTERYTALRLRMEALGLAASGEGLETLQERLLQSLARVMEEESESDLLAEQLLALSEAVFGYLRAAEPVLRDDAKERLQVQLIESEALLERTLQPEEATARRRGEARVLGVNRELGVVVVGTGRLDGVSPNIPFTIKRDGRDIAKVLAVEVRDNIAGCIIVDRLAGVAIAHNDLAEVSVEQIF
ncbi:MAG: hypothetical protein AAF555_04270 [Verrucomicrobiota bacterium]